MKVSFARKMSARVLDFVLRDRTGKGKYINQFLLSLNRTSPFSYYTYHYRPKRAANVHLDAVPSTSLALPRTAVVIQGPLMEQDGFTLESVRLYRRLMPDTQVIVSTWAGANAAQLELIQHAGAAVVISDPPAVSGANNVNFQLVSTRAGIALAKKTGCSHVLKTRSDQRFYAQNLLPYLHSMLDDYPSVDASRQRQRIIELSTNICRYRPYSMCDMFQFGHIDDMTTMWNVELDPRQFSVAEYSRQRITPRKISADRIAEIYIHRAYLEAIGEATEVDLRVYYEHLAKFFIVIDKEMVDLFWNKYGTLEYGLAENPLYSEFRPKARFYARDWHTVRKHGVNALDVSDQLLDMAEN